MSESNNVDKEMMANVIAVLVHKLGGAVSIRPHELLPPGIETQINQLPTGTLHLELVQHAAPTSDDPPAPSTADDATLMQPSG